VLFKDQALFGEKKNDKNKEILVDKTI